MQKEKIAIIGLGYVGLPLAVELSQYYDVIGFDKIAEKIIAIGNSRDYTNQIGDKKLQCAIYENRMRAEISSHFHMAGECNVFIVTVPTPVNFNNEPDLSYLIEATKSIGEVIGDIRRYDDSDIFVIYESTVYPGAIDEIREKYLPIFDVYIGYSPERVNPGDKHHTLPNTQKIIASNSPECLKKMKEIYGKITQTVPVDNIKVAEASKILENVQRDVNIALINEFGIMFHKMGIDTGEVLKAASTKWNFLNFKPGLVGGHCIGVDPYYMKHAADRVGYHPTILMESRKLNEYMVDYVTEAILKSAFQYVDNVSVMSINVLGITFKENVPDTRNSKVRQIIENLTRAGFKVNITDPYVKWDNIIPIEDMEPCDILIIGVGHKQYKLYGIETMLKLMKEKPRIMFDLGRIYTKREAEFYGIRYWAI